MILGIITPAPAYTTCVGADPAYRLGKRIDSKPPADQGGVL